MNYPAKWDERAPQLRTIARWINEHTTLVATCECSWSDTDRKVGRLRSPGKGRSGNRLTVWRNDEHAKERHLFGKERSQRGGTGVLA